MYILTCIAYSCAPISRQTCTHSFYTHTHIHTLMCKHTFLSILCIPPTPMEICNDSGALVLLMLSTSSLLLALWCDNSAATAARFLSVPFIPCSITCPPATTGVPETQGGDMGLRGHQDLPKPSRGKLKSFGFVFGCNQGAVYFSLSDDVTSPGLVSTSDLATLHYLLRKASCYEQS